MSLGSTSFKTHTTFGGGGQIAANYELVRDKLVLLANGFWSDGGAHYLVATGPELVVRPNAAGTDVNLSMVHAGAGSAGLEWRATPKQAFAIYYGADYFGRNFFPDATNTAQPGNHHRLRRARVSEYQQPRHSAAYLRLAANILEAPPVRGPADLRPVFVFDSRSLVCRSGRS